MIEVCITFHSLAERPEERVRPCVSRCFQPTPVFKEQMNYMYNEHIEGMENNRLVKKILCDGIPQQKGLLSLVTIE